MRIVFPTKENMSYISHSASTLSDADYLTVLDVFGQNITDVETIKAHKYSNAQEIITEFKEHDYSVLILPETSSLPVEELRNAGISVYQDKPSQLVLNAFSDYIHDKLVRA